MAACQPRRVAVVAAPNHTRCGNAPAQTLAQHIEIAPVESGIRQRQFAQQVVPVRIHPRVVKHQLRAHMLKDPRQHLRESRKVCVILHANGKLDVEIALRLAEGKIRRAVH